MMKLLAALAALLLLGSGCCKDHVELTARDRDIVVWLLKDTNGLHYEVERAHVGYNSLEHMLKYGSTTRPDMRLFIYLSRGLCVTNAVPLMESAERFNITNIVVRMNQIPEPHIHREPYELCTGGL
jgi:hypothetical protein